MLERAICINTSTPKHIESYIHIETIIRYILALAIRIDRQFPEISTKAMQVDIDFCGILAHQYEYYYWYCPGCGVFASAPLSLRGPPYGTMSRWFLTERLEANRLRGVDLGDTSPSGLLLNNNTRENTFVFSTGSMGTTRPVSSVTPVAKTAWCRD